jgi:hypothetical protein
VQREHFFECRGELPARFHLSLFDRGSDPVKRAENEGVFSPALAQMLVAQRFEEGFFVAQARFDGGDQVVEAAGEIVVRFRLDLPDPLTKGLVHVAKDGAVGAPVGFAHG